MHDFVLLLLWGGGGEVKGAGVGEDGEGVF